MQVDADVNQGCACRLEAIVLNELTLCGSTDHNNMSGPPHRGSLHQAASTMIVKQAKEAVTPANVIGPSATAGQPLTKGLVSCSDESTPVCVCEVDVGKMNEIEITPISPQIPRCLPAEANPIHSMNGNADDSNVPPNGYLLRLALLRPNGGYHCYGVPPGCEPCDQPFDIDGQARGAERREIESQHANVHEGPSDVRTPLGKEWHDVQY